MDWLDRHHASINWFKKEVTFQGPHETSVVFVRERRTLPMCLISSLKARKSVNKGCQVYIAHVVDSIIAELRLENVPVVVEFSDVFIEKLPGLPPNREIEFIINLLPNKASISKAPYRMAPTELKELKVQL